MGPLRLGTYGLMVWLGLVCGYKALEADLKRRRLSADALNIVLWLGAAGLAGSKLYHVLETPAELFADPLGRLFSSSGFAWYGAAIAGLVTVILLARHYKMPLLVMLDVTAPAVTLGYAVGRIGCLLSGDGDYGVPTSLPWGMSFPHGLVPTTERVHPTPIYEFLAGVVIFYYLWRVGAKVLLQPRPVGEVAAQYFMLSGLARFLVEFIRINPRSVFGLTNAQAVSLLSMAAGVILVIVVRRRFKRDKAEHRIAQHASEHGTVMQPEYHRATPECPHPERWRMYDSMTAEVEVLEFLKSLVTTVKPSLVVETGSFMGASTLWMAEGLKQNGFGKVITCEHDPVVFAKAKERLQAAGLTPWVDCRNQSSLELKVDGTIDLFFSDSDPPIREQEVRRFLPQVSPTGLILMHDASSHLKVVREAALRMEQEGLISVVLMPTPRGLVVAQKRAGRK
ncbi:MAG TPA: prolipoprotein diacylglyceryl transferase family protein [Terriglobales bacterium]|nr:prolipoprotein diacylglyceryl transferase family protein [Terriglobales bacterium]